jgi:uncharacterized membrane protein (UPF0127 family)
LGPTRHSASFRAARHRALPAPQPVTILLPVTETDYRQIVHEPSGRVLVERARWCDTFGTKLRGFTFRRRLEPGEGLVLVDGRDSRSNAAIHMFFVFVDLGVIWVNDRMEIVDSVVARPWRPAYVPQAPARYVIETAPDVLAALQTGDRLSFVTVA